MVHRPRSSAGGGTAPTELGQARHFPERAWQSGGGGPPSASGEWGLSAALPGRAPRRGRRSPPHIICIFPDRLEAPGPEIFTHPGRQLGGRYSCPAWGYLEHRGRRRGCRTGALASADPAGVRKQPLPLLLHHLHVGEPPGMPQTLSGWRTRPLPSSHFTNAGPHGVSS